MLAVAQILIAPVRPNDFARIHFPVRIPDLLKLAKCLDEFFAKHDWQKVAARLAVTVFA